MRMKSYNLLRRSWISSNHRFITQSYSSNWQSVIGLEVHAQIKSESKLFSGAGTQYGANTNSQVSFFDASLPGTLPVLNKRCVEAGVLTAIALQSDVNMVSKFDRKHYFYADMPAGYQITQQRKPLAVNGQMTYVYQCSQTSRVERRKARLVQIQLEQDSGKSLHDPQGLSLIDLNRAGVGLMEIVTAPVFSDGDDAVSFVRDLRDILVTIGTCDGKMSEGSLRVDANISVHKPGEDLGTRTEVKNLNSVRSIRMAINYEIERQIELLESGGQVINETRSFDMETGETVAMRDKEKLLDYRFVPEPNLPPLVLHTKRTATSHSTTDLAHPQTGPLSDTTLDASSPMSSSNVVLVDEMSTNLKQLPDQTRQRLEALYGQTLNNAVIIERSGLTSLFETLVNQYKCSARVASHMVRVPINAFLDNYKIMWAQSPVCESTVAELARLYEQEVISGNSISVLLEALVDSPKSSVQTLIDQLELWKVKDTRVILQAIDDVLSRNPSMIKAYKKGKTNQLPILSAKVIKQLGGKVDPKTIRDLITDKLSHS